MKTSQGYTFLKCLWGMRPAFIAKAPCAHHTGVVCFQGTHEAFASVADGAGGPLNSPAGERCVPAPGTQRRRAFSLGMNLFPNYRPSQVDNSSLVASCGSKADEAAGFWSRSRTCSEAETRVSSHTLLLICAGRKTGWGGWGGARACSLPPHPTGLAASGPSRPRPSPLISSLNCRRCVRGFA